MSILLQENYQLFQKVNSYAGHWPWLDLIMVFCANTLIFFWPVILLLLWGRPLSWRKRLLRPGEEAIAQECRAVVLWVPLACVLAYLLNLSVEQFIFEPRPFVSHQVHLLTTHLADDSFPSDHTAWSFAVLGMMLFSLPSLLLSAWSQRINEKRAGNTTALLFPLLLMWMALVMAGSIGLARVFVGVHYPGDILGGASSGLIAASIMTLLRHRMRQLTQGIMHRMQRIHLA